MLYTGYYAKAGKIDGIIVRISNGWPKWVAIDLSWDDVIPPWQLMKKFKSDADETFYTETYERYLDGKDLSSYAEALKAMDRDVFLMCYEAPDKFCHRHILARHLNEKYGLNIQEYQEATNCENSNGH